MLGSIRWNVAFAAFGFILTALFSFGNNPFTITLLRSVYAFIAFFILAFVVRYLLKLLDSPIVAKQEVEQASGDETGAALDLVTPEDSEDLNQLLKEQMAFQPLHPPKLVSKKDQSPEELAEAVRQLSEQT